MPASRGDAPALLTPVVPPQYPVRAVNGVSFRCDDSTSAPELWLEVQWEEEDEHGNYTVTNEPWAAMQDLPVAVMYMAQPAVIANERRLNKIALKRHAKNLKEAASILAFEVQ
jgi:8-oxo-dGTP pyrophosphatase MutT (NUDIX family)